MKNFMGECLIRIATILDKFAFWLLEKGLHCKGILLFPAVVFRSTTAEPKIDLPKTKSKESLPS